MNIIHQPDTLSLSLNIKPFLIGASASVSFVLKQYGEVLVSQQYEPGDSGTVEIDVRDIVHARLSYHLQDIGQVHQQMRLVSDFTAIIDDTEITFRVVRGGVDRLEDSASVFLTQNFLTWQPQLKRVTYYTPEFLTYYAVSASTAKLRAYFTDAAGTVTSQMDHTIASLTAGVAYTFPLQYAVVAGWLNGQMPAYYDVWVENTSGQRITYIQRYAAQAAKSLHEEWVLWENSLGGLDTFRAYGVCADDAQHTHNIAEIDEESEEYRVDTERLHKKNTGYLQKNEATWLLDFFPSLKKYIYLGNYLRQIVVTESDVTRDNKLVPTAYTFTYKYADARPLLNLPRTEVPATALNITLPDVGSFTLPPRLAEVARQPLSEGVIFPVQNPYSEEWGTTTIQAITSIVTQLISEAAGDGGGIGHTHYNYDLLKVLSYVEEYLLVNGNKIKAGYADKAGEIDSDKYIRKDQEDQTNFLLRLFGGTIIKKFLKIGEFITGVSGAYVDEQGNAEFHSIYARDHITTERLRFNDIELFKGYNLVTPGGGFDVRSVVDNGDGTYTIGTNCEEGVPLPSFEDDILTGYWYNLGDGSGESTAGAMGFWKVQFRVAEVDQDARKITIIPKPETYAVPRVNMTLGQTGNFTNTERQSYMIFDVRDGNCCITFFRNANTWDPEPAQMPSWFGIKKGMTVNGIPCDNFSAVLQNIIMTGTIFQVDEITGRSVRVPIDKGDWVEGRYGYYNRVTYDGCLWLCVAPDGTTERPSKTSAAWLLQVDKGADGKDGVTINGGGHWESSQTPYAANTMVTLANSVFVSLVKTSNPPIKIHMTNTGKFIRKADGGYILAGTATDWTVHPDWLLLLDGRELKGESIEFLGEFTTAPSNPKEGNSYYNPNDGCTYIYRKGHWMVMTKDGTDGKDGDNYEWIYQQGNIIGNPPAKPGSQQTNDYIPEGWTDDPSGVSEDYQIEWACKRRKQNGVWSEWSDPKPHARWGTDGTPGKDGEGIEHIGHWEAGKCPIPKNRIVSFARGNYLSKVKTSNPPLAIIKSGTGAYIRKADGGYILAGTSADKTVHPDWQLMTEESMPAASYWLDTPVSVINISSLGIPSPSTFTVTLKCSTEGVVSSYGGLYLVARKYDGSNWLPHVGASRATSINVPATAGYTQFTVRAYLNESDAAVWSSNYVCEKGVGIAKNATADDIEVIEYYPRDRYIYGTDDLGAYVWNDSFRDKMIYAFNGVYYNFVVKSYGSSVTVPPTSPAGDDNWEAVNVFKNLGADFFLAEHAALGTFQYSGTTMKSAQSTNGVPNLLMNADTGYARFQNVDIDGIVRVRQMFCKICTSSLTDGSFIAQSGVYIAPELPEGYACVVHWAIPLTVRAVLTLDIEPANGNVIVYADGDRFSNGNYVSFSCQRTAGVIVGRCADGLTTWDVIQYEQKSLDLL